MQAIQIPQHPPASFMSNPLPLQNNNNVSNIAVVSNIQQRNNNNNIGIGMVHQQIQPLYRNNNNNNNVNNLYQNNNNNIYRRF